MNRPPARAIGCVAICVASLLIAAVTRGEQSPGTVLSLLSYNVHGLSRLVAKDDPGERMVTIGWLADKYDVALFQEDFEYHDRLGRQMPGKVGMLGNGMGLDPRRLVAKVLLFPMAIFVPHFWPPYGAGLSIFLRDDLAVSEDVEREPYGLCNGWFGDNGDCWALKGYVRVGLRTADGATIDVYNTHLDAGASAQSVEVRREQLDLLARAVEARPSQRAVIIGGDFNTDFSRPGDRDVIMEFRRRLALGDSGAGPELPNWRERDYILFRSTENTRLSLEGSGEAKEFVNRNRALSDHPALYAQFRVERVEADP